MKKNELLVSLLICSFACAYAFYTGYDMLFKQKIRNVPNKAALAKIMNEINIGDSDVLVNDIFKKYKTEELKLNCSSPTSITIDMPYEFGASDWILFVSLKDKKVVELKMRTSDGPQNKPDDAPIDRCLQ